MCDIEAVFIITVYLLLWWQLAPEQSYIISRFQY